MSNFSPSVLNSTHTRSLSVEGGITLGSISPGAPLAMSSPMPPKRKDNRHHKPTLKLFIANCRSVSDKKGQFQHLIGSTVPDIVVTTETWLKPEQGNGEIGEPGRFSVDYTIHRRDRPGKNKGGGVFIAVKNDLRSTRCEKLEPEENCELAWVKVRVSGEKAPYIGAYYRPNIKDSESLAAMTSSITNLTNHTQSHTWLTGDFDLLDIMWENGSVKDGSQYRKHHQDFLDFLVSASLSQMVQTPTRGEKSLDFFATSNDTLVTRCDTIPGMSDHDCVLVESRLLPKKFRVRRATFPVWKKAIWNDIKTHINEAWGRLSQDQKDNSTSDSLWVWFKTTLEGTIQKHVLHRQVKGKGRHP